MLLSRKPWMVGDGTLKQGSIPYYHRDCNGNDLTSREAERLLVKILAFRSLQIISADLLQLSVIMSCRNHCINKTLFSTLPRLPYTWRNARCYRKSKGKKRNPIVWCSGNPWQECPRPDMKMGSWVRTKPASITTCLVPIQRLKPSECWLQ